MDAKEEREKLIEASKRLDRLQRHTAKLRAECIAKGIDISALPKFRKRRGDGVSGKVEG